MYRPKFSQLEVGQTIWLGARAGEKRIHCELQHRNGDGSFSFYVMNGAWFGTLYRTFFGRLFIVTQRGDEHDVHLVEINPAIRPVLYKAEIPF